MTETPPPPNRPRNPVRAPERRHQAGLLDIRNIIGGLLGVYDLLLLLMGLFGDKALDKTGDVNANLWAGIGLLVVAAAFLTWARLRPVLVPEHAARDEQPGPDAPQ